MFGILHNNCYVIFIIFSLYWEKGKFVLKYLVRNSHITRLIQNSRAVDQLLVNFYMARFGVSQNQAKSRQLNPPLIKYFVFPTSSLLPTRYIIQKPPRKCPVLANSWFLMTES